MYLPVDSVIVVRSLLPTRALTLALLPVSILGVNISVELLSVNLSQFELPDAPVEPVPPFILTPEKDHVYIMVCDVSRGKGLDYSAFQLIDVTSMPYNQVCVYRNNAVSPIDYADTIHRLAKAYNKASVLVEINDIGEQVSHLLCRYLF